jgi:hypothetical protein
MSDTERDFTYIESDETCAALRLVAQDLRVAEYDAVLNFLANSLLEVDRDASYDDGRWRDLSAFVLRGDLSTLRDLCEAMGMDASDTIDWPIEDAIQKALEKDDANANANAMSEAERAESIAQHGVQTK